MQVVKRGNIIENMDIDPTDEYQTRINQTSKENHVIVSERTTTMNLITPKLKGLVKLHKEARLVRPLVICIQ